MQAAVASAMLFSASAFAQVAVNTAAIATPLPSTFAKEIVMPATLGGAAVLATTMDITVGKLIAQNVITYVRVALDNGATFDTDVAVTTAATGCTLGQISGAGTNALSFSLTGTNAAGCLATDAITVASGIIAVNASTTNVSYSLHALSTDAQNGTGTPLYSLAAVQFLKFADSYALTSTANTVVAGYAFTVPFGNFNGGAPAPTTASLASLSYASVATLLATGVASTLATVLNTTTTLAVTGDFTSANVAGVLTKASVFIAPDATCASTTLASSTLTATTATFAVGVLPIAARTLCYKVDGKAAVPIQNFTAALKPVAISALYTVPASSASVAAGSITHDGTTLQSALTQTTPGYITRFVLTNTSTLPVGYTVATKAEAGNVVTAGVGITGTIPANSMVVVPASDVATFGGASRGFTVFSVGAPAAAVEGVFQIVNAATGSVSNTAMTKN
ncbi:MAG: hypothetical protein ACI9ZF_000492 [Bradyrhizobium sp.]|jgi:hypothetical protein